MRRKRAWKGNEGRTTKEKQRPRCLPFIKLLLNAAFLRTHNWIGKTAKIMPRPWLYTTPYRSGLCGRLTANTSSLYSLKWTPCNPPLYTALPHWPAPPGMHIDHSRLINAASLPPSLLRDEKEKKKEEYTPPEMERFLNDRENRTNQTHPSFPTGAACRILMKIFGYFERISMPCWATFQSVPLLALPSSKETSATLSEQSSSFW